MPAGDSRRDFYEILGVDRGASPDEIKRAYRQLAVRHHPDKNPGDKAAEEAFKEASEAYGILGDKEKRARYDRFGHAGVGGAGQTVNREIFEDFQDIFRGGVFDLFGDMFGGGGRRSGPSRGQDIQVRLSVDFTGPVREREERILISRNEPCEECRGTGGEGGAQPIICGRCSGSGQETISRGFMVLRQVCAPCRGSGRIIRNPCRPCAGEGLRPREREVTVRIPAGVDDGNQLRIPGAGQPGAAGGPAGDLYVVVHTRPHPNLHRDGANVLGKLFISFPEAALGAIKEVETVRGTESLRVPAGTQPGSRLRLRNRGFPMLRGRGQGDHVVEVRVEVPRKLSRSGKRAVEQLASVLGGGAREANEDSDDGDSDFGGKEESGQKGERPSFLGRLFS